MQHLNFDNLVEVMTGSVRSRTAHLFSAFFIAASLPVGAQQIDASTSQGASLTIYNQNFGLVRDLRNIELKDGINYVRLQDVAARIDPTSVSFTSLSAPNAVVVREQNYQYDLLEPNTILSKSVGKEVKFRQFLSGGAVNEITGTLLNPPIVSVSDVHGNVSRTHQGLVVKVGDRVVLNPSGQAELAELPAGLVSRPSLLWKLETAKGGTHKTEIAYQTQGLNWHCDYVAVVNDDDTAMNLTSWVTLDNRSGATYKNAALKLMAGDVHRVQQTTERMERSKMAFANGAVGGQFQEQAFAEYHLYSLQGKTDVSDNETKQLSLFNASAVPSKKLFIYDPGAPAVPYRGHSPRSQQKVNVKMEIENSQKNNLGLPLPKGKVRVYKKDSDGALQFIGEDLIDHTPRDEKVRLYIGDAFDLVGERKQTNYQRVSDHVTRYNYEISLRNHKDKAATITAVEHAYGQWKILSFSHPFTKKDSRTFEFPVSVPARSEVKILYEIEIRI